MNGNADRTRRIFLKRGAVLASSALATGGAPALGAARNRDSYVVDAVEQASIAVTGTDRYFPVRRVYCLGQNYAAHAVEMGDDPDATPPFFFMKPADAVCPAREGFPYPPMSARVGYEIELVIALSHGGTSIRTEGALQHVYGYAVGLDMTRRDLQDEAKALSRPWEGAKSFDRSAPTSPLRPVSEAGHPHDKRIWLSVNGEIRQDSSTSLMRWNIAESIATLSRYFELCPGDLIFSGTPAGVGLVGKGDVIRGGVEGVDEIEVEVI